jgi:hypothetical protein
LSFLTRMENGVKAKLWLGAVAGAGLLAGAAANAQQQNPPYDLWCLDQSIGEGSTVQICMAYTLQQCLDSRTSQGETCYLNPRYDPRFRRS